MSGLDVQIQQSKQPGGPPSAYEKTL